MLMSLSACSMFSYNIFKVSDLKLRSLIHFELVLVQGDRDLVSIFYRWISSFPNTICWRDCLFSNTSFWLLCQKSTVVEWIYSWSFDFISLVCFCCSPMLFLWLWLCSIVWSQVLWYVALIFFLRIAFAIWDFLGFHMNFCHSVKSDTGILMGIALNL
jgi:hypothetical protein